MSESKTPFQKAVAALEEFGSSQFVAGYNSVIRNTDAIKISEAENRGYETARKDITDLTSRMIELEAIIEGQRDEIKKQRDIIGDLERKANKPYPSGRFFLSVGQDHTVDGREAFVRLNFHESGHAFQQSLTIQQFIGWSESLMAGARMAATENERRHALQSRNPDDGSPSSGSQDGPAFHGLSRTPGDEQP